MAPPSPETPDPTNNDNFPPLPDPAPVLRVKAPPLLVPEPVLSIMAPPADAGDGEAVVGPEAIVTAPPSPELPEPTDNEIAPPAPPAAVPDTM